MSDNYDRVTVRETREAGPDRVVVRRGGATGWWIAALVAIVAIIAVVVMVGNRPGDDALQAARDQGATEANLANATANAQTAASSAADAAQSAASNAAAATESAARSAANQATQAADNVSDAAQDATSTEPPR
jgi:hypothetical protein